MGKKEELLRARELLDKSIKKHKEAMKEKNKIQLKPIVVIVPPPPKES